MSSCDNSNIRKNYIVISSTGSTNSNFTTVSYTSSNILNNDLVTVLPTPNSNEYYQFSVIFKYIYGTTPYVVSGFPILQLDNIASNPVPSASIPTDSNNLVLGSVTGSVTELGQPLTMDRRFGIPGGTISGGDGFINVDVTYELLTF